MKVRKVAGNNPFVLEKIEELANVWSSHMDLQGCYNRFCLDEYDYSGLHFVVTDNRAIVASARLPCCY